MGINDPSFPTGSAVKNLTAVQKTWVQSQIQDDPLEKEIATTPVFLPGKSHGQRSLVGYRAHGVTKELDTTKQLNNNNKQCPEQLNGEVEMKTVFCVEMQKEIK